MRLRPILMTTAAMVLGVAAAALSPAGAGAAARFSMGLVIASGMSIGTIFTLFVVPMFYTYIARQAKWLERSGRSSTQRRGPWPRNKQKGRAMPGLFYDPQEARER